MLCYVAGTVRYKFFVMEARIRRSQTKSDEVRAFSPRHLDMKIEELSRCQVAVPHTIDEYPIRSPQTVHSAIAALVKNKDIVEIGTRNGDGMACFAQHARRSIAIEMAPDYCRKLEQRSAALRAATGHNYRIVQLYAAGVELVR